MRSPFVTLYPSCYNGLPPLCRTTDLLLDSIVVGMELSFGPLVGPSDGRLHSGFDLRSRDDQ